MEARAVDIGELWDYFDPAGSERRFRAALVDAGQHDAAVLQTQIAPALGLQQSFAEAHAVLDAIKPTLRSLPAIAARVALERGRLYRSGGQARAAMPHFEAAVAQALRAGDDALRIDALHMIAILQERAPARKSTEIALAIARNSTDSVARAWEASLLNNLGMASAQAGDWTDALLNFKRAQRLRRRAGKPDEERVARWMVAWALRNLGRTEEALAMQRKLHAEHLAVGSDDPYVREELALLEGS